MPPDETFRMLHNVRDYCFTILTRAKWVMVDVEVIQQRPDWETLAEAELQDSLDIVREAQTVLQSALKKLQDKPVGKTSIGLTYGQTGGEA